MVSNVPRLVPGWKHPIVVGRCAACLHHLHVAALHDDAMELLSSRRSGLAGVCDVRCQCLGMRPVRHANVHRV